MGCDIHLYAERRVDGTWVSADTWVDGEHGRERVKPFYDGRSYTLFALLADVRNSFDLVPIAQPRGLPSDTSREVLDECSSWSGDGHSHSHFTVSELMAFDWTQSTTVTRYVQAADFYQWELWGRSEGKGPSSYSAGVGGAIKVVSEDELRRLIKQVVGMASGNHRDMVGRALAHHHTLAFWELPYYRASAGLLGETLPRLWRLGPPEDVRIVFWFDN